MICSYARHLGVGAKRCAVIEAGMGVPNFVVGTVLVLGIEIISTNSVESGDAG